MNKSLPTYSYRDQIVQSVRDNQITLITAETGSGKSTQVCQYLYGAGYDVVVTEPRRLAAVSLADRVSFEMDNQELVSYHTGFESTETKDTRILFCTDGLQLVRSLVGKGSSNREKVLIIDEIHEWNLNQETLIAWIKLQMKTDNFVKVIIMSATMELDSLSAYFGIDVNVLLIPGTLYPITTTELGAGAVVDVIRQEVGTGSNILVFVPGKGEIGRLISELENYAVDVVILPLHGELTMQEQKKAFASYNKPKIIVSTNVAQTSVTVQDIDCVVDTGTERRNECRDGVQGIFINDISKADAKQRAGRTKPGKYYLCSSKSIKYRDDFSTSEIERSILDQVVLRLAAAHIDASTLEFYHQPADGAILQSYNTLTSLGAIKDGSITEIGKQMTRLPVSARYSRMLIESTKYNLVEQTIKLVAILEVGGLLTNKCDYPYSIQRQCKSDVVADIMLYDSCYTMNNKEMHDNGINTKRYFKATKMAEKIDYEVSKIFDVTNTGNDSDMTKVYLSGMIDRLCIKRGRSGFELDGISYDVDNKSVVSDLYEVDTLVGIPTIIEFKGRWDQSMTKNLLRNCCPISFELLVKMYPGRVSSFVDEVWSSYNSYGDSCSIHECFYFDDNEIGYKESSVNSGPYYEKAKAEYLAKQEDYRIEEERLQEERKLRYTTFQSVWGSGESIFGSQIRPPATVFKEQEPAERIELGGNEYLINKSYRSDDYIRVDAYELQEMEGLTTVKNAAGENISIKCNGLMSKNVTHLLEQVRTQSEKQAYDGLRHRLPTERSSKPSMVNEFLELVGPVENDAYGRGSTLYVGLVSIDKKIGVEIFKDEEEYLESTKSSLKFLVLNNVLEKYGEKKFRVEINGKNAMTKKSEAVRQKFLMFVDDLLQDVSISSYYDVLEFIEESFNDSMRELGIM